MQPGVVIALLVVAAIVIAVIWYYAARFAKGSMTLTLRGTRFKPGQPITGSFMLMTKKNVQASKLTVSLIGTRHTRTYRDGKPHKHTREVYRDEVIVEKARAYPPGHTANYKFELEAPNTDIPEEAQELLGAKLAKGIQVAAKVLNNSQSHIEWKVEARLHAAGVDLTAGQKVTIQG